MSSTRRRTAARHAQPGFARTLRTALSTTLAAAALLGLPAAASVAGPEAVEDLAERAAAVGDLPEIL